MRVVRVQSRGQITIPEDIRRACGIAAGDELYISPSARGVFECVLLPKRRSVVEMTEKYSVPGPAPEMGALREAMGEELAREYDLETSDAHDAEHRSAGKQLTTT